MDRGLGFTLHRSQLFGCNGELKTFWSYLCVVLAGWYLPHCRKKARKWSCFRCFETGVCRCTCNMWFCCGGSMTVTDTTVSFRNEQKIRASLHHSFDRVHVFHFLNDVRTKLSCTCKIESSCDLLTQIYFIR